MKLTSSDSDKSVAIRHLTPDELSSRLRLCLETIRRKLRSGEIPALKFGRSWRVSVAAVEEYERQSMFPPGSNPGARNR